MDLSPPETHILRDPQRNRKSASVSQPVLGIRKRESDPEYTDRRKTRRGHKNPRSCPANHEGPIPEALPLDRLICPVVPAP